jgi:hypothetical protein
MNPLKRLYLAVARLFGLRAALQPVAVIRFPPLGLR